MPLPTDWPSNGSFLAGYTTALTLSPGAADWEPLHGGSFYSTRIDPDAVNSTLDNYFINNLSDDLAGFTANLGVAVETGCLGFTIAYSDGATSPILGVTLHQELITGHNYVIVRPTPAGALWIQAVVTLGDAPPTITDAAGLTWTQRAQLHLVGAYLTVWTAPVDVEITNDTVIELSEVCDSGIGYAIAPE